MFERVRTKLRPVLLAAPAAGLLLLLLAAPAAANVPGLKDPTRPLRTPAPAVTVAREEVPRPTLESVLVGGDRRFAVINGTRMTEGQTNGGVRLLEIHPDSVVVSVNGSARMTLHITNARMHKEWRR